MKRFAALILACLVFVIFALTGFAALANSSMTNQVTGAQLVKVAKRATLSDIDYGYTYCAGAITVDEWLKGLAGPEARAITWTGGKCQLVNQMNSLDAAGRWCAQATISLAHPKDRTDEPTIEVYLEAPKQGRPGRAYAFRSVMMTRDGDWDYLRFRKEFEAEWRERFPDAPAAPCDD